MFLATDIKSIFVLICNVIDIFVDSSHFLLTGL